MVTYHSNATTPRPTTGLPAHPPTRLPACDDPPSLRPPGTRLPRPPRARRGSGDIPDEEALRPPDLPGPRAPAPPPRETRRTPLARGHNVRGPSLLGNGPLGAARQAGAGVPGDRPRYRAPPAGVPRDRSGPVGARGDPLDGNVRSPRGGSPAPRLR